MAADGGVAGMIDRARPQDRLGAAEQVFHLEQVAVARHRLQRRHPGIGAQHEDAVEAGALLGQLAGIDLERRARLSVAAPRPAQVAAVGGIADQRLVAARQLLAEPGNDRLAVAAVALRLDLVAAQDVTRTARIICFRSAR